MKSQLQNSYEAVFQMLTGHPISPQYEYLK
jgi:hypothetical protein